jgi:hypothetical protein
MNRYLSLALLGFVGLGLAVPQESRAQAPVAVQVQPAPGVVYQPGYTYVAPTYVAPAPVVVAPRVIVPRTVYYPQYRVGYRWGGYGRWGHYRHHR